MVPTCPTRSCCCDSTTHLRQVAAGEAMSAAMSSNGQVYTWGCDVHGGLGHGGGGGGGGESAVEPRYRALSVQTVPRLVRHLLTEGVRVTKIAVGATHCACIDDSLQGGRLWTWGCGTHGQLGHRDASSLRQPRLVDTFSSAQPAVRVADVSCAAEHSAAIDTRGRLWSWGRGWLGHATYSLAQVVPKLYERQPPPPPPTSPVSEGGSPHPPPPPWYGALAQVSCGATHSAALDVDGLLISWGAPDGTSSHHGGEYGAAVAAAVEPRPVEALRGVGFGCVRCGALAGQGFVLALARDGELCVLGGLGSPIGPATGAARRRPDHGEEEQQLPGLELPPPNLPPPPPPPPPTISRSPWPWEAEETERGHSCCAAAGAGAGSGWGRVVDMSCGRDHVVVSVAGGGVWAWGCGAWGKLGCGDEVDCGIDRPRRLPLPRDF
jgi:alpha-tubulin suppressor-like RCC1 family protein